MLKLLDFESQTCSASRMSFYRAFCDVVLFVSTVNLFVLLKLFLLSASEEMSSETIKLALKLYFHFFFMYLLKYPIKYSLPQHPAKQMAVGI